MIRKSLVKLLVFGVFSFVFGALVMGTFSFTSKTSASSPDAAAAEQPAAALAPVAATATCTPIQVAIFSNRIHVRCAAPVGGISYFAYPTSNGTQADRYLSMLLEAQVAHRNLTVWYDPNTTSGTSYGCLASDCRPIDALAFGN
jgi:zona occludens toxin (predicted ATPase)